MTQQIKGLSCNMRTWIQIPGTHIKPDMVAHGSKPVLPWWGGKWRRESLKVHGKPSLGYSSWARDPKTNIWGYSLISTNMIWHVCIHTHTHTQECQHPHTNDLTQQHTSFISYMSFYKLNNLDLPYYTLSKKGEIYLREQLLERKGRLASVFLTSNMHEFDLSWNSKLTFYPRKL